MTATRLGGTGDHDAVKSTAEVLGKWVVGSVTGKAWPVKQTGQE